MSVGGDIKWRHYAALRERGKSLYITMKCSQNTLSEKRQQQRSIHFCEREEDTESHTCISLYCQREITQG